MGRPRIDITGKSFGKWTVLHYHKNKYWMCQCECGTVKPVLKVHLQNGQNTQCKSCSRKTHGLRKTSIYTVWASIKQRVMNPNCEAYKNYGGRGITLYEDWIGDFSKFEEYVRVNLGNRPDGYSLDRIDNDGNYEPGNLRWANRETQSKNRRCCN